MEKNTESKDNNENEKKIVTIYLDDSSHEASFGEKESFWENKIDFLVKRLNEHQEGVQKEDNSSRFTSDSQCCRPKCCSKEQDKDTRNVLNLSIIGDRGSGKSSVLRTFIKKIKRIKCKEKNYHVLKIIDPTILSNNDHFLYTFLANILEDMEKRFKEDDSFDRLRCSKSFHDVAEHLWAVNDKNNESMVEPLPASLRNIDRHRSGPLLKEAISKFINDVVSDLSDEDGIKPILILPIDDPDIAFGHFTDILDTIRIYLNHSYIVPVLCFSSNLVKNLLHIYFSKKISTKEIHEELHYDIHLQVKELGTKYFDKLLPPGNRIRLSLPHEQFLAAEYSRKKKEDEKENKQELQKVKAVFDKYCMRVFGSSELVKIILPSSLRGMIQLLDCFERLYRLEREEKAKKEKEGNKSESTSTWAKNWHNDFVKVSEALFEFHPEVLDYFDIKVERLFGQTMNNRPLALYDFLTEKNYSDKVEIWRVGSNNEKQVILSLLAAIIFKPNKELFVSSFAGTFTLWIIDLLYGFYLPLLAPVYKGNRLSENKKDDKQPVPISWNHGSTDLDIVRTGLKSNFSQLPGLLFLTPHDEISYKPQENADNDLNKEVGDSISPESHSNDLLYWENYGCKKWLEFKKEMFKESDPPGKSIIGFASFLKLVDKLDKLDNDSVVPIRDLIDCWCIYGKRYQPWATVSLWRGLSLIGMLLMEEAPNEAVIKRILRDHIKKANIDTPMPRRPDDKGFPAVSPSSALTDSDKFVKLIKTWHEDEVTSNEEIDPDRIINKIHGINIVKACLNDRYNIQ